MTMKAREREESLQVLGPRFAKNKTPPEVRALGAAPLRDRRHGPLFTHHDGVQSCYAGRGLRGSFEV